MTRCFANFLLISAALLTCAPCFSADEAANDSSAAKPYTLQGGIEHSEKLAPVEREFRRGAKVDVSKAVNLNPENHWYQLPDWAVGNWTSIQATRTYAKDLRSSREQLTPETRSTKMEFSWGFQKDKTGQVWEFAKEPYTLKLDNSENMVLKRVIHRQFLQADNSKVTLKLLTENVVVNKSNNQVVRTLQVENIQTCVPSPNDCMTCNASYKIFDEQGKAIELGKETNTARRISTFKPIDEYEGKNMPQLFKEFLSAQGRSDLID
ncbi:MAG: hypothetical protein K2X27_21900 [Candidatus Obscuribacterales bacterium]|nr:hypothetical protein [Candidatus Obscuribacterales bacterium]